MQEQGSRLAYAGSTQRRATGKWPTTAALEKWGREQPGAAQPLQARVHEYVEATRQGETKRWNSGVHAFAVLSHHSLWKNSFQCRVRGPPLGKQLDVNGQNGLEKRGHNSTEYAALFLVSVNSALNLKGRHPFYRKASIVE